MNIAKGSIVEGNAGQVLAVSHFITGLHVGAVCNGLRQILGDHGDGHEGSGIGQRVGIGGNVSLDRVSQSVHAGCGSQ